LVTIEKLRYLLGKAIAVFGDRRVGELTSQEIAAWRMTLSSGYRFEATQALRQVLHRAVVWGMIDINSAKVGVDNPTPRRKEQRPFESWAELEAIGQGRVGGVDRTDDRRRNGRQGLGRLVNDREQQGLDERRSLGREEDLHHAVQGVKA